MRQTIPLALGLVFGAAATAPLHAQTVGRNSFAKGTPVVIVGEITSEPNPAIDEDKMQVKAGGTEFTLHVRKADIWGLAGAKIDEDALDNKHWIRAEGRTMRNSKRIEVDRMWVIGKEQQGYRGSSAFLAGHDAGYFVRSGDAPRFTAVTAAPTEAAPFPVTLVAKVVEDVDELDLTKKHVKVQSGDQRWALEFPPSATVLDAKGEKLSVHDVDDGQWVHIQGHQVSGEKIRVTRMENIGNQTAYEGSRHFRTGNPGGYYERVAPSRQTLGEQMFIVGKVTEDVDEIDLTKKHVEVAAADQKFKLEFPNGATVLDAKGEKLSVHDVDEGQWVRIWGAYGDGGKFRVSRMQNIGKDELYRTTEFYRSKQPTGYYERTTIVEETRPVERIAFSGSVTEIGDGFFMVRAENGTMYRMKHSGSNPLKVGDRVKISNFTPER